MVTTTGCGELLDYTAKILIRCFFLGVVILLYWGGMIVFAGDFAFSVHSAIFPISSQQFYAINYAGIAFTKVCVTLFFLLPYIAIRLVQRKNNKAT
jgi:Family of unknown function (DUF6868)